MRLSSYITVVATFIGAGAVCLVAAGFAVTLIEDTSRTAVLRELDKQSLTWADADTNGLQVFLIGTAPSEAERFKAVSTAGSIVDAARVIDQTEVADREAFAPPRFSIEILRNDSGISLIGLIPETASSKTMREDVAKLVPNEKVSDLLESAKYPAPEGWAAAMELGMKALRLLPRSKISIDAGNVSVTAMSDSEAEKRRFEQELIRSASSQVNLAINISAPRPVISPFTLRFIIAADGTRFDACSADTEVALDTIVAAARRAGMSAAPDCRLGLGVPSRQWSRAAALSIDKLSELGGGTVTFADADITLVADEGTDQSLFDRVVGELETGLPEVFALESVLPVIPDASQGPPEFIATLSPEGQVQLRGRVNSKLVRDTADSYAKARFGSGEVYTASRIDESLPRDWSVRVLAAIETLSMLKNGSVTVTPEKVRVFGDTGVPSAKSDITRLLLEKLGDSKDLSIEVTYKKKLDPVLGLPTADECEVQVTEIQSGRKITFEPGSGNLDASAESILDDMAEILIKCPDDMRMEISGYTDSQGREVMNQELSQTRAQAVLTALRERRVLMSRYVAKGYGEENPIGDNSTEAGREANRRIEFKLIRPEPPEEVTTTLEAAAETAQDVAERASEEGTSDEQN
ncbi:MAG: OmpA family protein [Planktotalea sp.]|uniref:OmpA family protein n=1 Tax=Planktotalea sp. TaxID=2029877 RepID=UPI002638F271|nr:OmpA family protein [Planktotalea sp.]MDG1077787.1 OmpA family protein [Planktotalea sp.]